MRRGTVSSLELWFKPKAWREKVGVPTLWSTVLCLPLLFVTRAKRRAAACQHQLHQQRQQQLLCCGVGHSCACWALAADLGVSAACSPLLQDTAAAQTTAGMRPFCGHVVWPCWGLRWHGGCRCCCCGGAAWGLLADCQHSLVRVQEGR